MTGNAQSGNGSIRVLVIEDDDDYREAVMAVLSSEPGYSCLGGFGSFEAALPFVACDKPDVILLDLELDGKCGCAGIPALHKAAQGVEIIVITVKGDKPTLSNAIDQGASGYLVKPVGVVEILRSIREVHGGGSPMSLGISRTVLESSRGRRADEKVLETLTNREGEVLKLLAEGLANKEIAAKLGIADRTVGAHVRNLFEKLNVQSRSAAVSRYFGSR